MFHKDLNSTVTHSDTCIGGMLMKFAALLSLIIISFSISAFAEEPKAADQKPAANETSKSSDEQNSYVLCRHQKMVRTIRVDTKGSICKAIYTKEGKDDIVGKAASPDVCLEVIGKIRSNLEKNSWKCEDMKADRVSFTME